MQFAKEPPYQHGVTGKAGVLLVNLGTPEAPTPAAVRPYLKEFLSDPRVVEIPSAIWWFILNGFILPFRARQSAHKYASIWSGEGSPLQFHTHKQTMLLRGLLGERGHAVEVAYAMRYGKPAVATVLEDLKQKGCDRILILPMYPQYSGTTTASVYDSVQSHYARVRNLPELRLVKHFHDDEGYIEALTGNVLSYWQKHGRPEKLVMSFHGTPKRTLLLGDPYHCECHKTARLLAQRLGLQEGQYLVTFQSRFGKAEWLQPYTAPTLHKLGKEGMRRVDLICPGFVSDCLETLEEIAMEVKQEFLAAGGKEFHYIPCLNENPAWIEALADLAEQNMTGWPTRSDAKDRERQNREAQQQAARAFAMGARQ